jgi:hypothetical protein
LCAWLDGHVLDEAHRPDKTEVLVWSMHPSRYEMGVKTLNVMEVTDGACERPLGKALIRSLLSEGWILVVRSAITRPMLQWYVNQAVPGIEPVIEHLVDRGRMVQSMTVPLLHEVLVP